MNHIHVGVASTEQPRKVMKRLISLSILWLFLIFSGSLWSQTTSYHLIAGSFKTLKSANECVDALTMKGFAPKIIFPTTKSSYYRVSIYSSLDRGTVSSYKSQLPSAKGYWTLAVNGSNLKVDAPSSPPNPNYGRGTLAGTPIYHVIVGSFPNRDEALRSQGARQSQGFDAYLLDPEPGSSTYRLGVYRTANRRQAEEFQKQLQRSGKVPKAWVHEEKAMVDPTDLEVSQAGRRVVGGVFHLIGGSFKNFADADEYKQNMEGNGYSVVILFPKPGVSATYRVSIGRSAVKSQVEQVKRQYKNQLKKDAWIYHEK